MYLAINKENPLNVMTEVENLPRLLSRISNHGDTIDSYSIVRIDGVELKRGYTKSCAHFLTRQELRDISRQYGVTINGYKPRVRRTRRPASKVAVGQNRSGEAAGPSGEGRDLQEPSSETILDSDGVYLLRDDNNRRSQRRRARHS